MRKKRWMKRWLCLILTGCMLMTVPCFAVQKFDFSFLEPYEAVMQQVNEDLGISLTHIYSVQTEEEYLHMKAYFDSIAVEDYYDYLVQCYEISQNPPDINVLPESEMMDGISEIMPLELMYGTQSQLYEVTTRFYINACTYYGGTRIRYSSVSLLKSVINAYSGYKAKSMTSVFEDENTKAVCTFLCDLMISEFSGVPDVTVTLTFTAQSF